MTPKWYECEACGGDGVVMCDKCEGDEVVFDGLEMYECEECEDGAVCCPICRGSGEK